MNTIKKAAAAVATLMAVGVGSAQAGGLIGDAINVIAPGVGTQLDQLNHNLGNPVDHAAAGFANTVVPGSGTAMEAYWAAQRSGMLQGGVANRMPIPQPAMGNICATPAGRYPGPFNPIGMPCFAMTPWGPANGVVTR